MTISSSNPTHTTKLSTRAWLLLVLAWLHCGAMAQVTNLAAFDMKRVHFGIQLGYTQSKFDLRYTEDTAVRAALQGSTSFYMPGFHLAIITDLKLTNFINLRTLPGLTLVNRRIDYSWDANYVNSHPKAENMRDVESVYGEIPIEFKFRAYRWRNFRPYLIAGGCYGFDFASMRNNKNADNRSIVRLNTSDFRYSAGLGFDFYLKYVKFAIELKMAFGLTDLKIEDSDLYTRSVDNLYTRTFMLSFIFE